ncbi:MAG: carbon-nitrogen hydrolase family protein [Roseivirga sp.]|nr:carbon-nitrogen hydrolase family protein [Roseivirga sp.]
MKICLAQIASDPGNIAANIARHEEFISAAAEHKADLIVFPELSICGYEPAVAVDTALQKEDERLDTFQQLSDAHALTIGIGVPLKQDTAVAIAMLIFQPASPREVYAKKYLHEDEEPWFVSGESTVTAMGPENEIALAICYEISVAEHAKEACNKETRIYLSSVAKTPGGVIKASDRLAALASELKIVTMMSNCIGPCEGQQGGGKSAIWNGQGALISQLSENKEGMIIFDTETGDCLQRKLD